MSRRNRPGRPRTQPRDVEVDAVTQDGEDRPEPMAVEVVPIASLSPNPANVRLHDSRSIDGIAGSLRRFKQQKPLVIDQDGVVRAGNGTLAAAKQLGWTEIAVVRTTLTGAELVAYEIADNRMPEFSTWDDSGLGATLRALQDEDFDLDAVGFTDAEVDAMFGGAESEQTETIQDDSAVLDDDDRFVAFKFGDYSGRVSREVYDSFVAAYQARQVESGEPMMDDVLRAWLDV